MEYITAIEASKKWGVSLRQVQRLLAEDRIPGGKKYGHTYLVPADAKKLGDLRAHRDGILMQKSSTFFCSSEG
jgi:hypothetical protein